MRASVQWAPSRRPGGQGQERSTFAGGAPAFFRPPCSALLGSHACLDTTRLTNVCDELHAHSARAHPKTCGVRPNSILRQGLRARPAGKAGKVCVKACGQGLRARPAWKACGQACEQGRQCLRARPATKACGQGLRARPPHKASKACGQARARPGKACGQGLRARLAIPAGKACGQGLRARPAGKACGQGLRARPAGKASGQDLLARPAGKA